MALDSTSPVDFSLNDAPSGDLNWDTLFPTDPAPQPTPEPGDPSPTPSEPQTQPEPVTPQSQASTMPSDDFFIKAGSTVYKSKEDAENGIAAKDSIIERLRLSEIARTGVDPLTNKPVNQPVQPQTVPVDYTQDQQKYFQDLVNAVDKNDPSAYYNAQAKLVQDLLAPLAPTIAEVARDRAVQAASTDIKDIGTFLQSDEYRNTLQATPSLQNAIQTAESDMRMYNQLPELYRLAYWTSQGRRLPDLLKAAQQPQPTQAPQARPLTQPQTSVPPAPAPRADLTTPQGRKALQAQLESQGIDKFTW